MTRYVGVYVVEPLLLMRGKQVRFSAFPWHEFVKLALDPTYCGWDRSAVIQLNTQNECIYRLPSPSSVQPFLYLCYQDDEDYDTSGHAQKIITTELCIRAGIHPDELGLFQALLQLHSPKKENSNV